MTASAAVSIVHVLRAPMGGVMRHVRDLTLEHSKAGHRVGLICDVPGTAGYNEQMLEALAPYLDLGLHRVQMARSVGIGDVVSGRKVLGVLKVLAPDIVHGHGAKGGVYARAIGGMANRKAPAARLYSPHGGSLHYDPASKAGRVYFAVERMLERACDTILFVAEFERETYLSKIGEPTCPTSVIYNGLADDEWQPVAPNDDAADFLFIGEMRMLKGPDLLIAAIERLARLHDRSATAIMVGTGPDQDKVAAQIASAGLSDQIEIRPAMPARDAFALARTMVMPSRAEAMPYIVLEALGAGLPMIASRVGGIPEILGTDSPSLTAPDTDQLAKKMALALDDSAFLRPSAAAHAALHQRFSVHTMGKGVLEAYQQALQMRRSNPALNHPSGTEIDDPSKLS